MDLEMLKICTPMTSDFVRETNYIDVRRYKHLRLTSMSDCTLSMDVIFSHNGVNEGPCTSFALQPNMWATRRIDIILPFIKIRVIRSENEINKMLIVNCLGRFTDIERVEPSIKQDEEIEEPKEEHRSKSPFRAFVSRKKPLPQSQKIDAHDPRFPSYISRNSVLVGGYNNSVVLIPPPDPNVDSHLAYIDNQFVWQAIADKKVVNWKV